MKNKIIILSILAILFAPVVSHAVIIISQANLTINVNTQGSDSPFIFDLTECPTIICNSPTQINLPTQGLKASTSMWINAFNDEQYWLTEENVSGLKVDSVSCTSDNSTDIFWPQTNGVSFEPITNENIVCTFNNVKIQPPAKTPILIVPGILGTEMMDGNTNTLLWADVPRMIDPVNLDNFMDPLSFNTNLTPIDSNVYTSDVIGKKTVNLGVSNITIFDYTDGIINQFIGQGYVEGQDLFLFPYDWRYGVSGKYADGTTNEDLLSQKIKDILQQTGASNVDVVAHSMGGLVVKKYVMDNPTSHHIGKAVFVGVPNTGAVKAIKILLQGDNLGIPGLSDAEIEKISQNMPGIYDLLPDLQYYNTAGSFISLVDNSAGNSHGQFSVDENTKITDLDFSQSESFLTRQHSANQLGLAGANNLHSQSYDNFDLRTAGVDLYAIDGCKSATIKNIEESNGSYNNVEFNAGDGTVSLDGATNLPIDSAKKYYSLNADHSKMPSQDGIRQEIVNLLSGSNLATGKDWFGNDLITQDINKCQLNGKEISVYSPVNIFVTETDPAGVGNTLGLASDGSVVNEIAGADLDVMGMHKFLYLPQDGGQTYVINLNGTGTGTYTIKSQSISNSQITKTEVFSNLPVTPALTGQINISAVNNPTTLSIKQNSRSKLVTISPSQTFGLYPKCKNDCKNSGWRFFGRKFKNQGDCESFSETKR